MYIVEACVCTIPLQYRCRLTASIIHGSAIGPPSYVGCVSDFKPATSGNVMVKFADDSYIIISSSNVESRQREVEHAKRWAVNNNLKVNVAKYMEVVFYDKRSRKSRKFFPPPPLTGIKRVNTVKILGVTLSDDLSVEDHVHASHQLRSPDSSCATSTMRSRHGRCRPTDSVSSGCSV